MLHNIWNQIRLGRNSGGGSPRAETLPFDPLSHPAVRRMSPRELADLPLADGRATASADRRC